MSPMGLRPGGSRAELKRSNTQAAIAKIERNLGVGACNFEPIFDVLNIGDTSGESLQSPKPSGKGMQVVRVMPTDSESEAVAAGKDLVPVLLDLTYYKEPELVSAALGLLVRQFEQL